MTYYVQAYRKGQHTIWFTDSKTSTLPDAIAAATKLHQDWDRKVRVIDDNEVVHFRRPDTGPTRRTTW